ncbi:MAG TPA: hypothetical protein ENK16_08065 [Chromatiales bacterium]|nr:hypothetical protein [Chromatiales bacterium]
MNRNSAGAPALGPIVCVTFTAPDLDVVTDCYGRYLGYRTVETGRIDPSLATAFGASAIAHRPYRLLAPEGADDVFFRAIEGPEHADYVPFATHGWNAAELMVRNVDALAERLTGSPFRIIGEPQDLSFSPDIRAMQVIGPGQELLYLTEFKRTIPGLDVPVPRCDVDQTFIVILGGPSMDALQEFYASKFAVPHAEPVQSRVKGMSAAFGLPAETRYPIAALPLAGQCLIEVDQMPPLAVPRPVGNGELPAGISVVSFAGHARGHEPVAAAGKLYAPGNRSTVLKGCAGEILELLDR